MNVESTQSSIGFPINLKFPFGSSGTENNEQFSTDGLFTLPLLISYQGFVINNNQFGNGGEDLKL